MKVAGTRGDGAMMVVEDDARAEPEATAWLWVPGGQVFGPRLAAAFVHLDDWSEGAGEGSERAVEAVEEYRRSSAGKAALKEFEA